MAKDEEKKGNPMSDLKWFIIIILAVWLIGKFGVGGIGGQTTKTGKITVSKSSSAPNEQAVSIDDNNESRWKGMVKIGRGNGSSEYQPNQEYITLQANSGNKDSINITGWSLTNGKDRKFFPVNDRQVKGISNKVMLPKATLLFIPNGANPQEDIVLAPGGKAVITTGKVANGIPFEIKTNFKENICTGYIENFKYYNFTPSLNTNCPNPESEEGVASLDDTCYKFVRQMGSCHTPEFKDVVYKNKVPLTGYVDDAGNLTYACKDFIKSHYNYNSCVANHLSDENFFTKEWRVFLNQPFELWAKDREVITLYDREGKIVDELTYGY